MSMTLKVYEVDRHGRTTRIVRPKTAVTPVEELPTKHEFPACRCDQCRGGQQ